MHRDIDLAAGQTLRVILGANASTGYRWTEDAQISDTAVLVQTGHVAIASPTAGPGSAGG
ncbi:MAG: protease inhibitor I42 family protein [Mycobacterium sp.]